MSITSPHPEHPLLAAARTLGKALDGAAGVDPLFLSTDQKASLLVELTRVISRVTALREAVLAVSDDLADQTSNRSAGGLARGRDPDLSSGGGGRRAVGGEPA